MALESRVLTDTVIAAEDCRTMADVRQGIDVLDRELVALLLRRLGYIEAAARIKTDRDQVRDEARIEDVVAKVKASARAAGLPEALAEAVWRTLIDQSIAYELQVWDALRGARKD